MATIAGWLAVGVCLVVSFTVDTSSALPRETDLFAPRRLGRTTDTYEHIERLNEMLEKLVDVMKYEIRELPSAEKADMDSALLDQHERDIAVPFPELTYAPSKKSLVAPAPPVPPKAPKHLPSRTPKVRTAGPVPYGGAESIQAEASAAKKDLTVEELKRLLKILKKRDYDIPFPVSGDHVRKPQQ